MRQLSSVCDSTVGTELPFPFLGAPFEVFFDIVWLPLLLTPFVDELGVPTSKLTSKNGSLVTLA